MARVTPKSPDGLLVAVGTIMGFSIFLNAKSTADKTKGGKGLSGVTKDIGSVEKQILGAGIFLVVSSFLNDQVPEFMGPFLWLVIVVLLIKDKKLIANFYNSATQ